MSRSPARTRTSTESTSSTLGTCGKTLAFFPCRQGPRAKTPAEIEVGAVPVPAGASGSAVRRRAQGALADNEAERFIKQQDPPAQYNGPIVRTAFIEAE